MNHPGGGRWGMAGVMVVEEGEHDLILANNLGDCIPPPLKVFLPLEPDIREVVLDLLSIAQESKIMEVGSSDIESGHPRVVDQTEGHIIIPQAVEQVGMLQPGFVAQLDRDPGATFQGLNQALEERPGIRLKAIGKLKKQRSKFAAQLSHNFDKMLSGAQATLDIPFVSHHLGKLGRKDEAVRSAIVPALNHLVGRHPVESGIDLYRFELGGIKPKKVGRRAKLGIEIAQPVLVREA